MLVVARTRVFHSPSPAAIKPLSGPLVHSQKHVLHWELGKTWKGKRKRGKKTRQWRRVTIKEKEREREKKKKERGKEREKSERKEREREERNRERERKKTGERRERDREKERREREREKEKKKAHTDRRTPRGPVRVRSSELCTPTACFRTLHATAR